MRFEFAAAGRLVFGLGAVHEVAPAASKLGKHALLVIGRSTERSKPLAAELRTSGLSLCFLTVEREPTLGMIRRGTESARTHGCDLVIGFGGGSAVDAGKAIAALLANGGELLDYLEVIGAGKPLHLPSAPFIAVPTTAGTGSEVTSNAVLASPEHHVKVSLRSSLMLPRVAVVDPELTFDLPPAVTARTGLDALTQLIEAYVSVRANPLTDGLCREGIRRASRSLRRAYHDGHNAEARSDMALASLLSGLALANAGLGIVHGIAGPIGGMFPAPHGAVCAALLPHGMWTNVEVLRRRAPQSEALRRFGEIAGMLTGRTSARAEEGIDWVRGICDELRIPPLLTYGINSKDVPVLVEKASRSSSTKGNPVQLSPDEMARVLTQALG
jgi:alcohol dehydrogenase class IV